MRADSISLQELYTNPQNQTRSEALIIYNSDNPCENCTKARKMLSALLKQHYSDNLTIYHINLAFHPEFAPAFEIHAPLTLVIIRISDGAAFGYEKLAGIQSLADNTSIFTHRITEFIENFLN